MVKTRYGKTTKGQNMEVFVAGECAYTAQTTYAAFVTAIDSLSDGEIGVFSEAGALRVTGVPLASGDKFFIAQKVTGTRGSASIKKSNIYTFPTSGNLSGVSKGYAYSTPVKPVVYIGFNGTSGSLNAPTIATGQDYQISLMDTTPSAASPLNTVQANRTVATTAETLYSILGDAQTGIVAQLNNNQTLKSYYAPLQTSPSIYVADVVSNGTYAAPATTTSFPFVYGSKNVTAGGASDIATGDLIRVGTNAGTTIVYKVVKGTTAFTGAGANDFALDRPFTNVSATYTVFRNTVAPTEYGVKVTTADYFTTFRALTGPTSLSAATITYATNWSLGIGTPEETIEEEAEGTIFHSGSSTVNAQFAADYGQPTIYGKSNRAYATFKIVNTPSERSIAAPVDTYSKHVTLIVKAPYGSGTFTVGGVSQGSGFAALTSVQTGLSTAGTNTPVVNLAAILDTNEYN